MKTRLSVILFVYNGMPYLPDAVESILRKSFADFTFMIVNDAKSVKGY
jgi:glycosyltransferase involved in cell wall biosynthesis